MVERVYARLPVDDLARRIGQELREDGPVRLGRSNVDDARHCVGVVDGQAERCDPSAVLSAEAAE